MSGAQSASSCSACSPPPASVMWKPRSRSATAVSSRLTSSSSTSSTSGGLAASSSARGSAGVIGASFNRATARARPPARGSPSALSARQPAARSSAWAQAQAVLDLGAAARQLQRADAGRRRLQRVHHVAQRLVVAVGQRLGRLRQQPRQRGLEGAQARARRRGSRPAGRARAAAAATPRPARRKRRRRWHWGVGHGKHGGWRDDKEAGDTGIGANVTQFAGVLAALARFRCAVAGLEGRTRHDMADAAATYNPAHARAQRSAQRSLVALCLSGACCWWRWPASAPAAGSNARASARRCARPAPGASCWPSCSMSGSGRPTATTAWCGCSRRPVRRPRPGRTATGAASRCGNASWPMPAACARSWSRWWRWRDVAVRPVGAAAGRRLAAARRAALRRRRPVRRLCRHGPRRHGGRRRGWPPPPQPGAAKANPPSCSASRPPSATP